uniref:Uncharacterized protein n=1 Tax=Arundo donax TaxID=35708 RepID=A0A0A9HFW3_ARUDO
MVQRTLLWEAGLTRSILVKLVAYLGNQKDLKPTLTLKPIQRQVPNPKSSGTAYHLLS